MSTSTSASAVRDILLATTRTEGDASALASAVALARVHEARVIALVTVEVPMPLPYEWGVSPGGLSADLYDEARERGEAVAADLRTRLAASGVAYEVRLADAQYAPASRDAAMHARHADLSVVAGASDAASRAQTDELFVELLMDSGRPVLMVPPGFVPAMPVRRAVIAWQPSREAARAVHDALPLLRDAEMVDVLAIDPRIGDGTHGQEPGADIAAHLVRHGIDVRVVVQPRMGLTIGSAILRHAHQLGAQLLVAGGYSHARFREQILGGVTRELLAAAHLPVLFSH